MLLNSLSSIMVQYLDIIRSRKAVVEYISSEAVTNHDSNYTFMGPIIASTNVCFNTQYKRRVPENAITGSLATEGLVSINEPCVCVFVRLSKCLSVN